MLITSTVLAGCGSDDPVVTGSTTTTTTTTSSTSGPGGTGGDGVGGGGTGGEGTGGMGTGGMGGTGGGGGMSSEIPIGEPIEAPAEQWTWIPFEDAFCANGSTTGIGINITTKSKGLVIFLMGGGACWDQFTCYTFKTAANIEDGYGEAKFQGDAQGFLASSLFDRNDPDNPMKDYSYVFVPYCTGDVHSGDQVNDYNGKQTMHVGWKNMAAFMSRILPTFPDAERVLLAGSSAGGFGAGTNFWRVQDAFKDIRVDLIDDSGPTLPAPYLSEAREKQWRDAWNLSVSLPPGCAACATDLDAIIPYYAATYTKSRGALLSYTQDNVISQFYGPISTAEFEEGLQVFTKTRLDGLDNFRYYYLPGQSHVLLNNPNNMSMDGVVLKSWLKQMIEDDPAWPNVQPWGSF